MFRPLRSWLLFVAFLFACTQHNQKGARNNQNTVGNSNTTGNTTLDPGDNNQNNQPGCQCASWQVCDPSDNSCSTAPGRCANDEECGEWERCSGHYCERAHPTSCAFTYDTEFPPPPPGARKSRATFSPSPPRASFDGEVHPGPTPPGYHTLRGVPLLPWTDPADLTLPDYSDNMPLFSRAEDFNGAPRCYETPNGARLFFEDEAYDYYVDLVETSLGVTVNATDAFRTVIGLRGAYPGSVQWNLNSPDRFNDTLVLLWREGGIKRVKEFPVNTDTGENSYSSSSSLLPNRLYKYVNGTHRGYDALSMNEWYYDRTYNTADDSNTNGHWDTGRNGFLPPQGSVDYIRTGSGHNIHMGSVDAPLGTARVGVWSAGCQVIPGMANWVEFVTNVWTAYGDTVDYWLLDVRDLDPALFGAQCTPNGTHDCPYKIATFPYSYSGTTLGRQSQFGTYGCSPADESGPEEVFEVRLASPGTLHVSVTCPPGVDVDIHLLAMDDPDACLIRAHESFSFPVVPGRYLIVADTWVGDEGPLPGSYQLDVVVE